MNRPKLRTLAIGTAAEMLIGLGWGYAVESHTNEVARGKIVTAEACLGEYPESRIVTQAMIKCFDQGVPGGDNMQDTHFQPGEPIGFVDDYIASEHQEASQIEAGRMVAWSVAPAGVVVAAVVVFSLV